MTRARVAVAVAAIALVATIPPATSQDGSGSGNVASSARVRNEPPTGLRISISPDDDAGRPGVQVSPVPLGDVSVTVLASADDANGGRDLVRASLEVLAPDGRRVHGPQALAPQPDPRGTRGDFEARFLLRFFDEPGAYTVVVEIEDRAQDAISGNRTFEYLELLALAVGVDAVSFGDALSPGQSTHDRASAVPVRNAGNVRLDLRVSGTSLATAEGDAAIGADRVRYRAAGSTAAEVPLSPGGATDPAFDLAPGASSERDALFDIHVPTGEEQYVPAAVYTGRITVGAVAG